MSHREYFAHRFRFQRVLQGSLTIGGFFNFAVSHIPRPAPGFYLQMAVWLGCYYPLAASDVRRHGGIAAPAIS
ncbi:MAG: hypothetical protein IH936_00435 [Acidobacteria bacterium]|nr:hypothetical protein [Acidobacteriota bacterium]